MTIFQDLSFKSMAIMNPKKENTWTSMLTKILVYDDVPDVISC